MSETRDHDKILADIAAWREREKARAEWESLSKWQRRKRNQRRRKAEAEKSAKSDPWSSDRWTSK